MPLSPPAADQRSPGPLGRSSRSGASASSWMAAPLTCGASARPAAPRTTPSATTSSTSSTTTRPTASTRSPSSTWAAGGPPTTPSRPTGGEIDPGHQGRMERIIRACAERGMVVVVGLFYQAAPFGLRDAEAVRTAVRTVATALRPHRNVIINVANEQNSGEWADTAATYDFRDPDRVIELCRLVHEVDPERLVGGGGYDHEKNLVIGRSPEVDVLLFDTAGPDPGSGELYDRFVAGGRRGQADRQRRTLRRLDEAVRAGRVPRGGEAGVPAGGGCGGIPSGAVGLLPQQPVVPAGADAIRPGRFGVGRRSGHPLVLRACAGHEGRVGRSGWGGRGRARVSRWSGTKPTCSTTDAEPGRAWVASARSS